MFEASFTCILSKSLMNTRTMEGSFLTALYFYLNCSKPLIYKALFIILGSLIS